MSVTRDGDGPRPKDRVNVAFAADWVGERDGQRIVDIADGLGPIHVQIPAWATVEVLERADDPKVGEIRREVHDNGHTIWQVEEREDGERYWRCTYSTAKGNRGVTFELEQMLDMPVIGAAPGTPAADAWVEPNADDLIHDAWGKGSRSSVRVVNEPHGLPLETHRKVANHVADGDLETAIVVAQNAGVLPQAAREYVEGMSEYQTYLNRNGGETRYFRDQHGTTFRTAAEGRVEVQLGATWAAAKASIDELVARPYVREITSWVAS